MTPRGIRNNNPGNIELGSDKWRGLSAQQTDGRFAQFDSPEHGIRAMAKVLGSYQTKHGLSTPRQIIGRWAPAGENDVDSYVASVANSSGLDPDAPIEMSRDGASLISAMIQHENGQQPFSREQVLRGIQMAGITGGSGQTAMQGGEGQYTLDQLLAEKARRQQAAAPQAEYTLDQLLAEKARRQASGSSEIPANVNQSQPVETGMLEAAGRGALQGVTAGFSDEIAANQMPDPRARFAEGLKQGMSVEEAREYANAPAMSSDLRSEIYDQQLGEVRAANEQAQTDQPGAFMTGEIAGAVGGALVPGGAAANAVKGIGTAGRVAANTVAAGAQGAAYGFGTGEGGFDERRDNAVETGVVSAAAGGAIPIFGKALSAIGRSRATGKAAAKLREIAPAVDDLKSAASNLFTQAEKSGVVVSQQTMENLSDKVWNRAINMGARGKLHPGAMAALEELKDAASKGQATMADLMGVRRVLQMGANDVMNKDNTRIVSAIVDNFDDFMLNMKPKDFLKGGPSKQAVEEWKQARELWRRSIKAGVVESAFERASQAASGLENGLRQEFRAIITPKRGGGVNKIAKMFSAEELDAMRKVVDGNITTKVLRTLSKFGFGANNQNNFLGGTIGVGGGAAMFGPWGAVAVPVVGQIAGKGAEKVTSNLANTARAMVATGQSPNAPRLASNIAEKWLLQGAAALPAVQ
jgi:hypothetical protein